MKTIQIVAGQEIRALLRSKGIMITVVTMLVVVIAAIFGTSCGTRRIKTNYQSL